MDENYSSLREEAPGPGNDQAAARGVGSRAYTVYETVFAVITILSGYLFTRMWPASSHPFGALLFTLFLFVTGGIWLKLSGGRQSFLSLIFVCSSILFSYLICLLCRSTS